MGDASPVPELPDVTVYVERLDAHCAGETLERATVIGPSLRVQNAGPADRVCGRPRSLRFTNVAVRLISPRCRAGAYMQACRCLCGFALAAHRSLRGPLIWRRWK